MNVKRVPTVGNVISTGANTPTTLPTVDTAYSPPATCPASRSARLRIPVARGSTHPSGTRTGARAAADAIIIAGSRLSAGPAFAVRAVITGLAANGAAAVAADAKSVIPNRTFLPSPFRLNKPPT
jgi:hypothetical protein